LDSKGKLKPYQRKILLKNSELILNKINQIFSTSISKITSNLYLDSHWTDLELMDHWNSIYDSYGYLMDDFKTKWESEFITEHQDNPFDKFSEPSIISPLKVGIFKKPKKLFDFG
jgi:hypothetical protein